MAARPRVGAVAPAGARPGSGPRGGRAPGTSRDVCRLRGRPRCLAGDVRRARHGRPRRGTGGDDPARSFGDLAGSAGSVTPPAGLRERTLALAREDTPVPLRRAGTPRRSLRPAAWLAIAAALVVFVGGAAIAVDRSRQLDQARAENAALAGVTAALDHILRDPGHRSRRSRPPPGHPRGACRGAPPTEPSQFSRRRSRLSRRQIYRCWMKRAPDAWRSARCSSAGRRPIRQETSRRGAMRRPRGPVQGEPRARRRRVRRYAGADGIALTARTRSWTRAPGPSSAGPVSVRPPD